MRTPAYQYKSYTLYYTEKDDVIEPEDYIYPACILLEFINTLVEMVYGWADP